MPTPAMTPSEFLHRVATALNVPINTVPGDLDALAELICPALADYTRTRTTLAVDCAAHNIPTSDTDGPRSLYQMTSDVVKNWRICAPTVYDIGSIDAVLVMAGYPVSPNEPTVDAVSRVLNDLREANEKREAIEKEARDIITQRNDNRDRAEDLADQLHSAARLMLRMTATIARKP